MYAYIKGEIISIEANYIVVDNNGVGYMIYVANPYSYKIGEVCKVFVYQQIREDENSLYGFKTNEDKELFLKLISVKGLGCKMALPIISGDNKDSVYDAIDSGNINYLKKFPKIGEKLARQIILDLKGKLDVDNNKNEFVELTETLKSLGYKSSDIKKILPNIDDSNSLEIQVKQALMLLLK